MAALPFASLALAGLSWRFVECPFRVPAHSYASTRKRVFIFVRDRRGGADGSRLAMSRSILPTYLEIAAPALVKPCDKRGYEPQVPYAARPGFMDSAMAVCRRLGDGLRTIVVWGDSHANALSAAACPLPGYSLQSSAIGAAR
jgi:hypothetical protein